MIVTTSGKMASKDLKQLERVVLIEHRKLHFLVIEIRIWKSDFRHFDVGSDDLGVDLGSLLKTGDRSSKAGLTLLRRFSRGYERKFLAPSTQTRT